MEENSFPDIDMINDGWLQNYLKIYSLFEFRRGLGTTKCRTLVPVDREYACFVDDMDNFNM